jgi:hypothetical protein
MFRLVHFVCQSYDDFVKLQINKLKDVESVPINIEGDSYINSKMADSIKESIKVGNKYTFDFVGIENISITVANVNHELEKFLIFYSCFLIYLFSKIKKLERLDITLIASDFEKALPKDGKSPLSPFEVNGGVTWSSATSASVLVYRREEIVKVLTHELIHAFNIDEKYISQSDEAFINDYFKLICKSAILNEGYTDSLACLLNVIVYTHLETRGTTSSVFKRAFSKNLAIEKAHIIEQAEKVMKYNNYYIKKGDLCNDASVCEMTHVTSYYIVKAIIYTKIGRFIKLIESNNMCISVPSYLDLIKKNMKQFIKMINLKKNFKTKNLRMSSIDILNLLKK